ncbi:alpha-glucosidase [Henriciella sp.]|uniref:alpha-glucosidase n=1 Tax=Henriciella sp. TaxID=1968823 RepID=UPI00262C9B74|nr:alpha-glucosidase [Henriciella sp.]
MSGIGNKDEPWWKGAVIYQVYPRSFRDTTGDGVGDLQGIIKGLPHIASLGVDAVWLSPFFTSPMKDYGYDVADYCGVDPMFGTLADFDRLIETAHGLGLKVVIDQVWSHTSDQHDWFTESRESRTSPKADWYVWADPKPDGSPPNNWQAVFGGPSWEWDGRRQQYYMHNFLVSQPDLNLHNEEVQDALLEVARFWLDRGVDGFRLDAINFAMHDRSLADNPPSGVPMEKVTRPFDMQLHTNSMSQPEIPAFLERVRTELERAGETFSVAEVVGADAIAEMKAFTEGEARLHSAYNFDFLYAQSLSPARVKRSLEQWAGADGEGWPSWAFSNHDAPRAVSRWAAPEDRKQAADMLLLLLLSLRGNVFLYQGEELGLPQAHVPFEHLKDPEAIANWPRTLGRDGARTPIPWKADANNAGFSSGTPWLPLDPGHAGLSADLQEDDSASSLNITRELVRLRHGISALRHGTQRFIDVSEGMLAYEREVAGDGVLCVFNIEADAAEWRPEQADQWRVIATEQGAEKAGRPLPSRLARWSGYWAVREDRSFPGP